MDRNSAPTAALFLVHPFMGCTHPIEFLSNQFRKVKVVFFLPYFISANQVQDLNTWKDRLKPSDQYHFTIFVGT